MHQETPAARPPGDRFSALNLSPLGGFGHRPSRNVSRSLQLLGRLAARPGEMFARGRFTCCT
eukprot:336027-Prymnesium_polylepis.1